MTLQLVRIAASLLLVAGLVSHAPVAHAECSTQIKTNMGARTFQVSRQEKTVRRKEPIPDSQRKTASDTGINNSLTNGSKKLSPLEERWLVCNTPDPACLEAQTSGELEIEAIPIIGQVPQPTLTFQMIQAAATQLDIGKPEPQVGPDPSLNEWGIVAVGYPIWLWVDGPSTMTQSVTEQGITINLVARRTSVVFDMGDGSQVTCTDMPRWPGPSNPPKPSPSCGYSYQRLPKTPGAGYTMSVTASWDVAWSALGQSGTLALSTTGDRNMPVGELQSVLVASGQR